MNRALRCLCLLLALVAAATIHLAIYVVYALYFCSPHTGAPSWQAPTAPSQTAIPLRLHQTYKSQEALTSQPQLREWRSAARAWQHAVAGGEYRFYSDAQLRDSIPTWFLPAYDAYPFNIQRVDAARYFLLHEYGGIYSDLDIAPRRGGLSFVSEIQRAPNNTALLSPALGLGASNDLMAAPPGHPLFWHAISHLHCHANSPWWLPPMFQILWSAGSLYLTASVFRYQQSRLAATYPVVMDERLYRTVVHLPGSSWHQWDSKLFLWLYHSFVAYYGVCQGVVLLSLAGLASWRLYRVLRANFYHEKAKPA